MKSHSFTPLPLPDPKIIAEQNDITLKQLFKGKIRGQFLISIKNRVMVELGIENLMKYYDFHWSEDKLVTGAGEASEYDICWMITGIHKAHSIFLPDAAIRKNEKNETYRQQMISETIEKIKLRPYGSIYFRKKQLFQGENFLYYPLPYGLFATLVKMSEILSNNNKMNYIQFYYSILHNGFSALSLMEDNLLGGAYPLCRGAIEIYLKLLISNSQSELYKWHERFTTFEIKQSCCTQIYPEEFDILFENRICKNAKNKVDYLHFGWVDFINGYHDVVKKFPYSVYGIITYLKNKKICKISELEELEHFYKSCHIYTHGNTQIIKYPILHYFEISIMLYYIIRNTFLLLCKENETKITINELDIIALIDRDFEILYKQYSKRSTKNFENYYNR